MKHYNGIKVMADYTSSGLWNLETGGMIDFENLKLPSLLIKALKQWIDYYDGCWTKDYSHPIKSKLPRLNNDGRVIARKIKVLYPKMRVEYWGEDYDKKFKCMKEEIIQ
jgi:hypothetical protein